MKVTLLSYTDKPEYTVALAGKICYSDKTFKDISENLNDESIKQFIENIKSSGHLSVLEHASFTFGIEGASRALTHQLVRHRVASYSQQSQRYVNMENVEDIIPPTIDGWEEFDIYLGCLDYIRQVYKKLIDLGVPKEDARYILPNACTSSIAVTMNARELIHFFEIRLCNRAQWEIREMADIMLFHVKEVAPNIFKNVGSACVNRICPEGKNSCGKQKEMRNIYGS